MARSLVFFVAIAPAAGTACGGQSWVGDLDDDESRPRGGGWIDPNEVQPAPTYAPPEALDRSEVLVRSEPARLFRNTYYDFPREGTGPRDTAVYDAQCNVITKVERAFYESLCVQGSGRAGDGATLSFARRDCACAEICPRTDQKICFERLDPEEFPYGRGATGRAITPLRSVAVDPTVIPLGTRLYMVEYDGLPIPGGSDHDGCFIAEDRGLKVVGDHIDVFAGAPEVTEAWNRLVPSNQGVHVELEAERCRSLRTMAHP